MRNALLAATAAIACLAASYDADATVYIGLQEAGVNGGAITTVASGPSSALASTSYGTFSFNAVTGASRPTSPNPLDTTALNVSSAGPGTLNVYVSATDLPALGGALIGFTENLMPDGGTVAEAVYRSAANAVYGLDALLAATTFFDIGSEDFFANVGAGSLTAVYRIASEGAGTFLSTIHVEQTDRPGLPMPAPEGLPMLVMMGAIVAAGIALKRSMPPRA